MEFDELYKNDADGISEMSAMASEIVREHYDPIIGREQNDYMLAMFQTEDAIKKQLDSGYRYFFVRNSGRNVGFMAFYPKKDSMYLSKFYLYRNERGKGYARSMMGYVKDEAKKQGLGRIELNVNKNNSACRIYEALGLRMIRSEKNDIGSGYFMDDYVYGLDI